MHLTAIGSDCARTKAKEKQKLVRGMIAGTHDDILIRGTENTGKFGEGFSLVAEMTLNSYRNEIENPC
jgi:hypothetical protein